MNPSKTFLIAPSILSADLSRLGDQIREAEQAGVDWIHLDVMDGHFVPNITMGPFIAEACRRVTQLPLDVHLMVSQPEKWVEPFASAGASLISVHIENHPHLHRTLQTIHQAGCKAGIVLNPGTPVMLAEPVLHMVELVLVMSVNPGFSGQTFLPEVLTKIRHLVELLSDKNPAALIEADGGISPKTLPQVYQAGVRVFVAGHGVFRHPSGIAAAVAELRNSLHSEP